MMHLLHKFILAAYKTMAVVILYGMLLGVVSYIGMTLFYAVNSTWVAPFIVTQTNDKILDMTAKLVASQQSLNTLTIDRDRLEDGLGDMRSTKRELDALDKEFQTAIALQKSGNVVDSPDLTALNNRKRLDNIQTEKILSEVAIVEARIDKDLAAGLITQSDAAVLKTQLRQSKNMTTDGEIAEVLLRDSVRSKAPTYTSTVDALAKEAELKSTIVQLAIEISSGEEQLDTDKSQIVNTNDAVEMAQNSPYFLATKGNVKFAFVSYDTSGVKSGVPIYGCLLNMIICHQVGTIKHVFSDEERITHPIFHTDVRGFLIQLDLTEPEAAKDKVLFVGHKPLLF